MSCLCAAQLKLSFQTDLGRENLASYYRQGRQYKRLVNTPPDLLARFCTANLSNAKNSA